MLIAVTAGFITVHATKTLTPDSSFLLTLPVNLNSNAGEIYFCLHWAPYLLNLREAKVFQKYLNLMKIYCESAWSL